MFALPSGQWPGAYGRGKSYSEGREGRGGTISPQEDGASIGPDIRRSPVSPSAARATAAELIVGITHCLVHLHLTWNQCLRTLSFSIVLKVLFAPFHRPL